MFARGFLATVLVLGGGGVLGACDLIDPPPVCAVDDVFPAPEAADPCTSGRAVARLVVEREAGPPNTGATSFRLSAPSEICLIVRNEPNAGGQRIASTSIAVDGVDIGEPSDLNQGVEEIVRRIRLDAGSHELSARVTSVPGAALAIEVLAAREVTPADGAIVEELHRLAGLTCDEANLLQGALDDDERERRITVGRERGMPFGVLRVFYNAYSIPAYLSPLPTLPLGLPAGSAPADIADTWLAAESALFRLDPSRHLLVRELVKTHDDGSAQVVYVQITDGLRVLGAGLSIHVDPFGTVRTVSGNVVPDVAPDLMAIVTEEEAVDVALVAVDATPATEVSGAELVLADLSRGLGLARVIIAWKIQLRGGGPLRTVWIDAETGEVVHVAEDLSRFAPILIEGTDPNPIPVGTLELRYLNDIDNMIDMDIDCFADPGCDRVREAAFLQRRNWILGVGRVGGWSGDGSNDGRIPPDAPFHIITDLGLAPENPENTIGGTCPNPGIFGDCFFASAGSDNVRLEIPEAEHWDVVWHEICHLYDHAERNFLYSSEFGVGLEIFNGTLGEHIGDVCAILLDANPLSARGASPFAMETSGAGTNRRHDFLFDCSGYDVPPFGTDLCDLPFPPSEFPGDTRVTWGCAESTHVGNLRLYSSTPGLGGNQRNSCVLTKVPALLLAPFGGTSTPYRGLSVPAMDRGLVELVWDKLWTVHLADAAMSGDRLDVFVDKLVSQAALAVDNFCRTQASTLCPATLPFAVDGQVGKALDAVGFWTPALMLTFSADKSVGIVQFPPPVLPVGLVTWIFFIDSGVGELRLYEDVDLLDSVLGTVTDLSSVVSDPSDVLASGHVTADRFGSTIRAAYISDVDGNIKVLTTSPGLGSAMVTDLGVAPQPGSRVAIEITPTATFVAFEEPGGGLSWLTLENATPISLDPDTSARRPDLEHDPGSGLLHLVYVKDLPGFVRHPHHRSIDAAAYVPVPPVFDPNPDWSADAPLRSLGATLETALQSYETGFGDVGPVAAIHRGELQVLFSSPVAVTVGDTVFYPTQLMLPLLWSGVPDFSRPSRRFFFDEPSLSGVRGLVSGPVGLVAVYRVDMMGLKLARKPGR